MRSPISRREFLESSVALILCSRIGGVRARNSFLALLGVWEEHHCLVRAATANSGWVPVYQVNCDGQPGDLLRIRAQVEMTNDAEGAVRGQLRIAAGGLQVSTISAQNCLPGEEAHHMPLWAEGVYPVLRSGPIAVGAEFMATRTDGDPAVQINDGYGHLVVEQYRMFPSESRARLAGARGVVGWAEDKMEKVDAYGGSFEDRARVYRVSLRTVPSDLVRLYGQATSQFAGGLEMHGQGIWLGDSTLISPWSTENTPYAIQTVPLWTDGLHQADHSDTVSYTLTMHGVTRSGSRPVVRGAGHLYALQFRRLELAPDALVLLESKVVGGSAHDVDVKANDGWRELISHRMRLRRGDLVRVFGSVQLGYPHDFPDHLGILCEADTQVLDEAGEVVDRSNPALKSITRELEQLPLRSEQLVPVRQTGNYRVRLRLQCTREGASPFVTAMGDRSRLIIDRFGAPL